MPSRIVRPCLEEVWPPPPLDPPGEVPEPGQQSTVLVQNSAEAVLRWRQATAPQNPVCTYHPYDHAATLHPAQHLHLEPPTAHLELSLSCEPLHARCRSQSPPKLLCPPFSQVTSREAGEATTWPDPGLRRRSHLLDTEVWLQVREQQQATVGG